MNHNHNYKENKAYSLKNFLPLIIIFSMIIIFTLVRQIIYGFEWMSAMHDFMGSFFIIFGAFKIINLKGFVQAYRMYDILAQRSIFYAYLYPFIELVLGIMYLMRFQLIIANWITLVLMIVSSIGVARELAQNKQIVCACLGAVFKIPMTYVTLAEDLIMGVMAAIMLLNYYL